MLCFLIVSSVFGQVFNPVARLKESQSRAAAVRAARVDALRQLGEAIQGVRINSRTTVKDFVTESDEIHAQFDAFLQGAQQEGKPNIYDDGTVTVKMVIYLQEAVQGLQQIAQNSNKISPRDVANLVNTSPYKKFEAVGNGAMNVVPSPASNIDLWSYVTVQGKLMARRAAQMDAYRNMAETLEGIKIDSKTTVKDFVAQSDTITASFQGIVRGVQFEPNPVYRPDGVVEINAFLDVNHLMQFLSAMNAYAAKDVTQKSLANIKAAYPQGIIRTTGVGVPPANYVMRSPSYPPVSTKPDYNRVPGEYTPPTTQPVVPPADTYPQPPYTKPGTGTDTKPVAPIIPDTKPVIPGTQDPIKPVTPVIPQIPAPPVPPGMVLDFIDPPELPPLPKVPERFVPEWAKRHITATGNGAYPENMEVGQSLAMARRAAQVDAYRLLAENAMGVKLQSETTIKEFVAENDLIKARVNDVFLRGGETTNERDFRNERYFEVDMRLYLGDIWEIIDAEYNKELIGKYGKQIETFQPDYSKAERDFQSYQVKLDDYRRKAEEYKVQLESYYRQQSANLASSYPKAKEYKDQYNKYMAETQGYQSRHNEGKSRLDKHRKDLLEYMAKHKEYKDQYKKLYEMYKNESEAALMEGPPVPPVLVYSGPTRGIMPPLPKVPERFVPEWANKEIKAKGIGAYPKDMDTNQAMAMAKRAAQIDAYRLLVENAMGVRLSAETTVKDFVTQSDTIKARVQDAYLRGAEEVAGRDIRQDRYYEIEMKLYLGYMWEIIDAHYNKTLMEKYGKKLEDYQPDQIRYKNEIQAYQAILKEFKGKYLGYKERLEGYYAKEKAKLAVNHSVPKKYQGLYEKYRKQALEMDSQYQKYEKDLQQYQQEKERERAEYEKQKALYQQKYNAYQQEAEIALVPPPPMPPAASFKSPVLGGQVSLPEPPQRFVPEWAKKHIKANGTGIYPKNMAEGQAMAMARRAAQVDAYRVLVESAMGVHLKSETSVQDFLTQKDEMTARVKESFLRGAQEIGGRDVANERYYEITMQLYLGDMWEIIDAEYNKVLMEKYGKQLSDYQPDQVRFRTEMEIYQTQLLEYKKQTEDYYKELDKYYAQYGSKFNVDLPLAKKYKGEYQKNLAKSQEYKSQYAKYQKEVEAYQAQKQQHKMEYEKYQAEYEKKYNMYKGEAEVALIPAPPAPPALIFNAPQAGTNTVPAPPERFVPEWARKDITATGTGSYPKDKPAPQAKLLAQRAAQVDAYRLLVESAVGVHLQSQTAVKDFIAQKDRISTKVNDVFLKGAQVVAVKDVPERQYCQVEMKLYLGDMWEIIDAEYNKVLMQQYGQKLEDFQPDQARYRTEMELYQSQLNTFQQAAQAYRNQLNEYNSRYGSKLALDYPICKKHRDLYQKYLSQAQSFESQYSQHQQSVINYQREKERQAQDYEQYKTQAQRQYQAYERESQEKE